MQGGDDGVGKLLGGGSAADVPGDVLAVAVDFVERGFDAVGGGALAEIVEHHNGAEEQGSRVSEAFAGNVGGGAVNSFKHGGFVADVGAADDAEPADKARGEIAHDVAIEIGQEQHVELLRIEHDLHAGVVYDEFLVFDVGILWGYVANGFEKEAIGELHDIGFVDGVNLFAAFTLGVFESEVGDLSRSFFGDDFEALDDAGDDFVFQAGVEVFGVFADEDDVDVFEARFNAGKIFNGADVGVKIEGFAQAHVDAGGSAGDGGAHGAFEGDAITAHGFHGCFGDELALFGGFVGASLDFFPIDFGSGRFEDAARGGGHFRADAFAGDQRDFVSDHGI